MSPRLMRVLLTVPLILLVASTCWPVAGAQGLNQVGLVVQKGDGSYLTRCIQFSEPQISGYDVLLRSGLALEISMGGGMGALVCGIDNEGCPAYDCMCDYPPNYWSYWHLLDGEWVYSQMGVSGYLVSPGNVEGWSWGAGAPPTVIPLEQICVPPATDTPTPTATWTPSPTASATPTWTPTATATSTPTYTPMPLPPTATALPADTSTDTPTPIPPTATALPADTAQPTAAETPASPPTATRASTGTPGPTLTVLPTSAPTAAPPTATEAASATPLQPTPTSTFSASQTLTAVATVMPTQVAMASQAAASEQPTLPQQGQGTEGPGRGNLLTWLSVGAGVAYLSFFAFVALLGALFVFVRLRQR